MLAMLAGDDPDRPVDGHPAPAGRDRPRGGAVADAWAELRPRPLQQPWSLPMLRVDPADGPYVVKWTGRGWDDDFRAQLLVANASIADTPGSAPLLVAAHDGRRDRTVTVRRWVPGQHRLGRLTGTEATVLAALFRGLTMTMAALSTPSALRRLPAYGAVLSTAAARPGRAATQLAALLADTRVRRLLGRLDRLADIDVHRENVLFTDAGAIRIDAEFCCAGPALLGPACQLAEGVLLYEPLDLPHWLVELGLATTSRGDLEDLAVLMRLRLLQGLAFFEAADPDPRVTRRLDWYADALGRLDRIPATPPGTPAGPVPHGDGGRSW